MSSPKIEGYSYRQRTKTSYTRVVADVPTSDVQALDEWGIRQGLPSRTAVVRLLVKEAIKEEAPEPTNQSRSDASNG